MPYLFSPSGIQALKEVANPARRLLLALDFDGTLAPIVPVPASARAPLAVSRMLAEISKRIDVAVVSGRAVADVSGRLGFNPRFVVGNHGIEGIAGSGTDAGWHVVKRWRSCLDSQSLAELAQVGVQIEDKGHSLSFHYRLAKNRVNALAAIDKAIERFVPPPHLLSGKCVIDAVPENSPNKFDAISELVARTASDNVIFAGDDVTDDVVFEKAPPHWLTIRVAQGQRRSARFYLAQAEIAMFLQRLLGELQHNAGAREAAASAAAASSPAASRL